MAGYIVKYFVRLLRRKRIHPYRHNRDIVDLRMICRNPGVIIRPNPNKQETREARLFADKLYASTNAELFREARDANKQLIYIQHISQKAIVIDEELLEHIARIGLIHDDPRIRGETCHALGLSGRSEFKTALKTRTKDVSSWVRKEASNAILSLEHAEKTDTRGDISITSAKSVSRKNRIQRTMMLRNSVVDTRVKIEDFEENHEAYEREENVLKRSHKGKFAVFCDGELVAIGTNRNSVLKEAMQKRPDSMPYMRQVGEKLVSRPYNRC